MKKFALSLICFILTTTSAVHASFVEGLEDVPVMEGLSQMNNDNISFGNEESRLVEAILSGESVSGRQAREFYQNTLPQMGWVFQGSRGNTLFFEREGEVMDISTEEENPLRLRITVKSKN